MTVKIVTDSTADLSPEVVKELGITVVAEYVLFGDKTYRDGIDISYDELYEKLINNPKPPSRITLASNQFNPLALRIRLFEINWLRKTCNSAGL